jgi:hypothetical protein
VQALDSNTGQVPKSLVNISLERGSMLLSTPDDLPDGVFDFIGIQDATDAVACSHFNGEDAPRVEGLAHVVEDASLGVPLRHGEDLRWVGVVTPQDALLHPFDKVVRVLAGGVQAHTAELELPTTQET